MQQNSKITLQSGMATQCKGYHNDTMTRTPVASSNLATIGYDNQHQMLEIEFRNGSIYQYFNVPQHIYSDLMNAGSHGHYFDAYVKKGNYRYRQVR